MRYSMRDRTLINHTNNSHMCSSIASVTVRWRRTNRGPIVLPVILEHCFTSFAFEIKANHGERRKEEEGGGMGCQCNARISVGALTPRYANRFDEDRLSWNAGRVIVINVPGGYHGDGVTRRDRTLVVVSSFPSGCAGPAGLNEDAIVSGNYFPDLNPFCDYAFSINRSHCSTKLRLESLPIIYNLQLYLYIIFTNI